MQQQTNRSRKKERTKEIKKSRKKSRNQEIKKDIKKSRSQETTRRSGQRHNDRLISYRHHNGVTLVNLQPAAGQKLDINGVIDRAVTSHEGKDA
jgi:hypothetical protein